MTQPGSEQPVPPSPGGTVPPGQPTDGPGGVKEPPQPGTPGDSGTPEQPSYGDIFGGGDAFTSLSAPATSSLNLLGKIEQWGIGTGTQLHGLTLRVDQLTGAQLQELIRKLPDGMTYALDLEKEGGQ